MAAMTSIYLGGIGTWSIWKACLYTMMPGGWRYFAPDEISPSPRSASEIGRTAAQATFWLFADTSACLCGHLHDPRLKGSCGIGRESKRQLGSVGWAKARSLGAVLTWKGPGWARFALPTLRCCVISPRKRGSSNPAGAVGYWIGNDTETSARTPLLPVRLSPAPASALRRRADAGQVRLHEWRQRHPGGFSQLLCGQRS